MLSLLSISFWALALLCLWNLNGILGIAYGQKRAISVFILMSGLVALICSRQSWRESLGWSGTYFILFLVVYVSLAMTMKVDVGLGISYFNSIFLVLVSACATRAMIRQMGFSRFIVVLSLLACLGAYTVFLSPYLSPIYQRMSATDNIFVAGRWLGFFANPNSTGIASVFALATCLSVWMLEPARLWVRLVLSAAIALLGLGVLMTFSRSSILSFIFLIVLNPLLSMTSRRREIGILIAGLIVTALAYWFFTDGYKDYDWNIQQRHRLESMERILTLQGDAEKDYGYRNEGMIGALRYWARSPVFGHGLGAFHEMPEQYFGGLGCHNTYLLVLGESGIFGAIAFACFLFVWGVTSWKAKYFPAKLLCMGVFIAFCMNSVVSHSILDDRNINILIGVCFGLLSIDRELAGLSTAPEMGTRVVYQAVAYMES